MTVRSFMMAPLLALLACGGEAPAPAPASGGGDAPPPEPTAAQHETRDTLVIGHPADLGNLLSVVQESAADGEILNALSTPLIVADFDCSLKKKPGFAESWEWSADGTQLTMVLRQGLTWEDGHPVTADDVAFTFDLIGDPAVASARLPFVEKMVKGKRPEVIDANTIRWHFTEAYDRDTQMGHVGSIPLLPKHVLADADRATLRNHALANAPLSYGPWRLAKWEPNERIVLEPNDKYTGPAEDKPHLNRVIFRVIPEYASRLLELEAGRIDVMDQILVEDADRLREEHPEIRLERRGYGVMDYIAWNLTNPLFADPEVRTALAHAVDVDSAMGKLLSSKTGESYAKRSVGTITPELCGVHNDEIAPLRYDLDKAKAMLAEAGWSDTDGDGVVDKDGKPFRFTLTTMSGLPRRSEIQVLVQANLKQAGVDVQIEQMEQNAFFETLRKRDFEAAISGWQVGLFVDPSSFWHSDTADKKYEFNFTSYANPSVDALIEKGLATPDPRLSAPVWKQLQAEIYADQPYLFLWWMDEIVGVNERFEDAEVNMLSPVHQLHKWKVPADKVKYRR
ncbi:MAG: peptide/nickel transport system substrate-binding protein [Myxococcota bacterium]|jgi:peptide/nickel transport system substrate-binding protein